MRHYCTLFDRNYFTRGLSLYRSLVSEGGPVRFWVLCLDAETLDILSALRLPGVHGVALATLEEWDAALAAVKPARSRAEYYFTCSPIWPRYLLEAEALDQVTYLDADQLFYHSPEPIFEEMGSASILITPHRFPPALRHKERFGIYNVSLLSFRRDAAALACLAWWRERCLEWCFDRLEEGKFADQKYLDDWPAQFSGVHVLSHPGAGLAPWNWANFNWKLERDALTLDGLPLIFYHFQNMKRVNRWLLDPGLGDYGRMPRRLRNFLYGGYASALAASARQVAAVGSQREGPSLATGRERQYRPRTVLRKLLTRQLMLLPQGA